MTDNKNKNQVNTLLNKAVQQDIISVSQYKQILNLTESMDIGLAHQPRFIMAHLLYYFGGLIALCAMSWFVTIGFDRFGGVGIMTISTIYAIVGMFLVRRCKQSNLMIPHSILLAFVLVLVPLFVFGVQQWLGIWGDSSEYSHYRDFHNWISWQWIIMELATLVVGALMLWRYKRSFVMLPISVVLWYLSMDIAPLFTDGHLDYDIRRVVSIYFGIAVTALSVWVDSRQARVINRVQDFAFWLYIVGAMTFWCGLTFTSASSEWLSFVYFMINLVMMFCGLLLRRRIFVIFAGIGSSIYFAHLAEEVFKESLLFPLVLTAIGLGIIYLGVLWQRHEGRINDFLLNLLPTSMQVFLNKLHATD